MVDADSAKKVSKTPSTPSVATGGSKTLFVGNLSFSLQRSDLEEFFKDCGEVVDVRFFVDDTGRFKRFRHVEFAIAEAAQSALELNEHELLNHPVRLDLARERANYYIFSSLPPMPHIYFYHLFLRSLSCLASTYFLLFILCNTCFSFSNSFQKGDQRQTGQTIFIRGFDKSLGEEIRASLNEHFGSCREISRVSVPKDFKSGGPKWLWWLMLRHTPMIMRSLRKLKQWGSPKILKKKLLWKLLEP